MSTSQQKGLAHIILIIGVLVIVILAVGVYFLFNQKSESVDINKLSQALFPEPKEVIEVDWVENAMVQPLPSHASPIRLNFPVAIDNVVFGEHLVFQGFGMHVGDRSEGVEVVAFTTKPGTIIKNLADGVVVQVTSGNDYMGCQVQIDYGSGLAGRHHFLKECKVKKNQKIPAGHSLGEGNSIGDSNPSFEFLLKDENRSDGAESEFGKGSAVSMFDYLNETDQKAFTSKYQAEVIEPFVAQGKSMGNVVTLWEPWLTNKVLLHQGNPGKLTGEWLLNQRWGKDDIPDLLAFVDADHMYYKGTHMRAINAYDWQALIKGYWEADYTRSTVKISNNDKVYYAGFEIDESSELAALRFEYQPGKFADYIEHAPVNIYTQAREMGVIK